MSRDTVSKFIYGIIIAFIFRFLSDYEIPVAFNIASFSILILLAFRLMLQIIVRAFEGYFRIVQQKSIEYRKTGNIHLLPYCFWNIRGWLNMEEGIVFKMSDLLATALYIFLLYLFIVLVDRYIFMYYTYGFIF